MVDSHRDCIYLRNLHLSAIVGKDAWQRHKPQPLVISIKLYSDITVAGKSDDINQTTSYGQICKDIQTFIEDPGKLDSLLILNYRLANLAGRKKWGGSNLHISSTLPKGLLRAEGGLKHELVTGCSPSDFLKIAPMQFPEGTWYVNELKVACIIGVNAHERLKKQMVVVSLKFTVNSPVTIGDDDMAWMEGQSEGLLDRVIKGIEESSYETLEALATQTAKVVCQGGYLKRITVSVEKPSALAFVDGAGVEITRTYESDSKSVY